MLNIVFKNNISYRYYHRLKFYLCGVSILQWIPFLFWHFNKKGDIKLATNTAGENKMPSGRRSQREYVSRLANIFINNHHQNRSIYNHYRIKLLLYPVIQIITFMTLFYWIDKRFLFIGIQGLFDVSNHVRGLVFDITAKCDISHYGSGGGEELRVVDCALPLNYMQRTILIGLWYVYVIGLLIDAWQIFKMLFFYCFPSQHKNYLIKSIKLDLLDLKSPLKQMLTPHDFFLLGLMSKSCDRIIFQQFVFSLNQQKEDLQKDGLSRQMIFRVY